MDEHKYCKKLLGGFCIKHIDTCFLCLEPMLPKPEYRKYLRSDIAHNDCLGRWYTDLIMHGYIER